MDMEGKEKQLEDWLLQVFPHLGSRPGGMERKKAAVSSLQRFRSVKPFVLRHRTSSSIENHMKDKDIGSGSFMVKPLFIWVPRRFPALSFTNQKEDPRLVRVQITPDGWQASHPRSVRDRELSSPS